MGFWLSTIIRTTGAMTLWTVPLVQLQSELDARKVQERLAKLEDPISSLHEDVRAVSRDIYEFLKSSNNNKVNPDAEFYSKYQRVLAILDARGLIKGSHGLG